MTPRSPCLTVCYVHFCSRRNVHRASGRSQMARQSTGPLGPAEITKAQLERLIEASRQPAPGIDIHWIQYSGGVPSNTRQSWAAARVVYLYALVGSIYLGRPERSGLVTVSNMRLSADALSPEDSVALGQRPCILHMR
jgi:hypothetical protein